MTYGLPCGGLVISEKVTQMRDLFRKTISHPALALGSTLLWGLIEFIALQSSRLTRRASR